MHINIKHTSRAQVPIRETSFVHSIILSSLFRVDGQGRSGVGATVVVLGGLSDYLLEGISSSHY
jgi:hypothetical protein